MGKALAKMTREWLLLALLLANGAWVIATMWAWFAMPIGAPTLRPFQAAGLAFLVQLMSGGFGTAEQVSTVPFSERLVRSIVFPPVFLGIGYVIRCADQWVN